tara:strand:+ start:277 stop:468 length:192 start_codon:yes stop_codon:yes gene_type:complete
MIILEVDYSEFEKYSFDYIWDAIRDVYEERFYKIKKIEKKRGKMLFKLNIIKRSAYLKERRTK